jgi:hypothetical protein
MFGLLLLLMEFVLVILMNKEGDTLLKKRRYHGGHDSINKPRVLLAYICTLPIGLLINQAISSAIRLLSGNMEFSFCSFAVV